MVCGGVAAPRRALRKFLSTTIDHRQSTIELSRANDEGHAALMPSESVDTFLNWYAPHSMRVLPGSRVRSPSFKPKRHEWSCKTTTLDHRSTVGHGMLQQDVNTWSTDTLCISTCQGHRGLALRRAGTSDASAVLQCARDLSEIGFLRVLRLLGAAVVQAEAEDAAGK